MVCKTKERFKKLYYQFRELIKEAKKNKDKYDEDYDGIEPTIKYSEE